MSIKLIHKIALKITVLNIQQPGGKMLMLVIYVYGVMSLTKPNKTATFLVKKFDTLNLKLVHSAR